MISFLLVNVKEITIRVDNTAEIATKEESEFVTDEFIKIGEWFLTSSARLSFCVYYTELHWAVQVGRLRTEKPDR